MADSVLYGSIDIGGTKIRMGLVEGNGRIRMRRMHLTPSRKPWQDVLEFTVSRFTGMVRDAGFDYCALDGIGIGCPGTFDRQRNVISFAPNLAWRNIPIKSFLERLLPVPIRLENDTNLATLGVAKFGEGRKARIIVGIFIGTGIGGGVIINNDLFSGSTGGAGEVGHIVVKLDGPKCACGNRGCLEAIASTRALYRRIHRIYARRYKGTDLFARFNDNGNWSLAIESAYRSHEPAAVKIIDDALVSLGMGTVSLINLFNPDLVIFGGGLAEALGGRITKRVRETVTRYAMPGTYESVRIIHTALGEDAPLLGGAALAAMRTCR